MACAVIILEPVTTTDAVRVTYSISRLRHSCFLQFARIQGETKDRQTNLCTILWEIKRQQSVLSKKWQFLSNTKTSYLPERIWNCGSYSRNKIVTNRRAHCLSLFHLVHMFFLNKETDIPHHTAHITPIQSTTLLVFICSSSSRRLLYKKIRANQSK